MYDFVSSLPAYKEGNKDFARQQVFIAVRKLGVCTDKQIAEYLGWPINRVTPRRLELQDKELIEQKMKAPDPQSKRTVSFWQVKTISKLKQQELF